MGTISIKNLTVEYVGKKQTTVALDDVSVQFDTGTFNVVVGASGSGKTTLLSAICDAVDYDGDILFDGVDSVDLSVADKNISLVSQKYLLYPHLSVFDNIAFPLKAMGARRNEIMARVKDFCVKLGLGNYLVRRPKELSGGQQQLVALARAIVKNPSVCLLDEPLSNVDAQKRPEVRKLIVDTLRQGGCTVVYVTHDISEAFAIADKIFVLDNGKMVLSGTPDEVAVSGHPLITSARSANDYDID